MRLAAQVRYVYTIKEGVREWWPAANPELYHLPMKRYRTAPRANQHCPAVRGEVLIYQARGIFVRAIPRGHRPCLDGKRVVRFVRT